MKNNLDKPVEYLKNIPINFGVYEIEYCPIHLHNDIEIAYMIKGDMALKFSDGEITLREGNLFIINSNYLHDIRGLTEDHQIFLMRIDITHYEKEYPNINNMVFSAENVKNSIIDQVKDYLLEIYNLNKSNTNESEKIPIVTEALVSTLVSEFQIFPDKSKDMTLLEETEKKLLGTEDSIKKVAMDSGFKSSIEFCNKFNEKNGCSPTEYREKLMPLTISNMNIVGRVLDI